MPFDPATLPLDALRMLEGLKLWAACESPTFDAEAVNRMVALAGRDLAMRGARTETIAGRMGFGNCLRATFPHRTPDEPGILVLAHLDTVHPVGTLASLPVRQEGSRCFGPGIYDMKGGTYLAMAAMEALRSAGVETVLPVTMLLTSDEEVGSPSTRDLIEREAARHRYVLVPEPGRPDDGVVTGRYAIARYDLLTTGRPSHAGARLKDGRSAVREMARRIVEIDEMTTDDCTFSVGVIHGGQWVNCIATTCRAEALSMAKKQADLDRGIEAMLALRGRRHDVDFEVSRGVTRPVWEPDEGTMRLYEAASAIATRLGFAIPHQSAGGGSDGNFTGAMGIPTLDGLGVIGGGGHTLEEFIEIDSLERRGRLFAGLLATLS